MSPPSQDASPRTTARVPKLRRGQERVASLLAAAGSVFVERGYEAATMSEIAARAGASIGSLYQFFPTKTLIAEALHLQQLAALNAAIDTLASSPGDRSLPELAGVVFDTMAAFMVEHPAFIDLAERRDIDPVRKAGTRSDMLGRIAHLVSTASPRPTPARCNTIAVLLLTMMKAAVSLQAVTGETPAGRKLVAELRAMLTRYFSEV
jgi:AcrR family transcriptional regulator